MLKIGLYEQVINQQLRQELEQIQDTFISTEGIDRAEASKILTKYLSEGSKPMNVTYRLEKPIPAKFIKKTNKLVAG